jgi:hypothetical protein
MLEGVLRRFGVGKKSVARKPTYFEGLLEETRPRVARALVDNPNQPPLEAVMRQIALLEAEKRHIDAPDLDNEATLGAIKAYFSLLGENDALPPSGQLNARELRLTRQLLLSSAAGIDAASDHSEKVLSLLEDKFNGGKYTQAGLLLRLFETTPARERNNERTLFYEEMFSRFGVLRLNRIPKYLCDRYREALAGDEDALARIAGAAAWLAENAGVHFNILYRSPDEVSAWRESVAGTAQTDELGTALPKLPPARWRNVGEYMTNGLVTGLREYFLSGAVFAYSRHLLKVCYFIVLVTGKTGYETFLNDFFSWVARNYDYPGTRLLPELHRRTTLGDEGLASGLDAVLADQIGERSGPLMASLTDEAITKSLSLLAKDLEAIDPNDIPPGEYDLTGLLLDRCTGLTSEDPKHLFRVHRIC